MLASPQYPLPALAAILRQAALRGDMEEAGTVLSCFVRLAARVALVDDMQYLHYTELPINNILLPYWAEILEDTDVSIWREFLSDESVLMPTLHRLWLITEQARQFGGTNQEMILDKNILSERAAEYVIRIAFKTLGLEDLEDSRLYELLDSCADALPPSEKISTFFGLGGRCRY